MPANTVSQATAERVRPASLLRFDFDSHAFDHPMRKTYCAETTARADRLRTSEAFQDLLLRYHYVTDETCNKLAKKIRSERSVKADFETAVSSGIEQVDNPCEELRNFMKSALEVPAFIDMERVERGGATFQKYTSLTVLALYLLPVLAAQTVPSTVVHTMLYTNRPNKPRTIDEHFSSPEYVARGRFVVRIIETLRFVGLISDKSCSKPYSTAFIESCRIRLVHGHVRNGIEENPKSWNYLPSFGWDDHEFGKPISAADGMVVLTSFFAGLGAARREMGLKISEEEMDDLHHWYNYFTHLQGVPAELLFKSRTETDAYIAAYFLSLNLDHRPEASFAFFRGAVTGDMLTHALPRGSLSQKIIPPLLIAMADDYFGQELGQRLGVPKPATWAKVTYQILGPAAKLGHMASHLIPGARQLSEHLNRKLWNESLGTMLDAVTERFGAVAQGGEFQLN